MSEKSIGLTSMMFLLGLIGQAQFADQAEAGAKDPEMAVNPPFYECNIPPDGGVDRGKRQAKFIDEALTDRLDGGVRWNNDDNNRRRG